MKWAIYGEYNIDPDITAVAAFNPRTARAYCEGRKHNADAGLVVGNPFTAARERENYLAWIEGFESYTTNPNDKGYCAV